MLDDALQAQIDTLELVAKTIAEGAMHGMHTSKKRGSSVAFKEHKIYTPGDMVQRIDWHAHAKTDRFYIKQYFDETNMHVAILLDNSGSMGYQSQGVYSKFAYARTLASALCYIALKQSDSTTLATCAGDATHILRPRAHIGFMQEMLHHMLQINTHSTTHLTPALNQLSQSMRRPGLIIILSDLFDTHIDTFFALLQKLIAKQHSIMIVHVLDPMEIDFNYNTPMEFICMEDSRKLRINPLTIKQQYTKAMQHFLQHCHNSTRAIGAKYHYLTTTQAFESAIFNILHKYS